MLGFLVRQKNRRPAVFGLAVVVALLLLGSAPPAVAGVHTASQAESMLSLVNSSRLANGLGPLKLNPAMNQVAVNWANQMAANGSMTHNPSYTSQIPTGWTRAAENVAQGYPTVTAMHTAWMNSSGHRANILGDFTDIGIAFVSSGGAAWGVENFGKYGASVPAPKPEPPATAPTADPAPTILPGPQPSPSIPPLPTPTTTPSSTPFPSLTPMPTSAPPLPARPVNAAGLGLGPLIAAGGATAAIAAVWWFVAARRTRGKHL